MDACNNYIVLKDLFYLLSSCFSCCKSHMLPPAYTGTALMVRKNPALQTPYICKFIFAEKVWADATSPELFVRIPRAGYSMFLSVLKFRSFKNMCTLFNK